MGFMKEGGRGIEIVVVPPEPGAVRPLPDGRKERDDVDEVVDELLGAADDRPPGPVDALLVLSGGGLAHRRVLAGGGSERIRSAAHAAVAEVATVLGGAPAGDEASRTFVRERADAVTALADALDAVPAARRARMLEARREVAEVGGFDALTQVETLAREVSVGGEPG